MLRRSKVVADPHPSAAPMNPPTIAPTIPMMIVTNRPKNPPPPGRARYQQLGNRPRDKTEK